MGGCFSSGSAAGEDCGEKSGVRVWPSDQDGYYERDVDTKARIFIDNFHRHRSGEVCDCPQTPAAAAGAS